VRKEGEGREGEENGRGPDRDGRSDIVECTILVKYFAPGERKWNRYHENKFLSQLGLIISTNIGQWSSDTYLGNVNLLQPEIIENICDDETWNDRDIG
jgi:hypothetical protein